MRQHDPVEIVTIGAGMTASVLAARILPETSHTMVSIEQAPAQWTYPDFAHNHDGLRYSQPNARMHDLDRSHYEETFGPDGVPAGMSIQDCPVSFEELEPYDDSYGQVWDSPNVVVTGSSLFPQNPGSAPSGTAGALAFRTAEAVRDRYFQAPEELLV